MYRTVAGLDSDDQQPGYKRILFRPRPDSGLDYAKASLNSSYGQIRSEWKKEAEGAVSYEFQLPPNTTALVKLRGTYLAAATINGQAAGTALGVFSSEESDGELRLHLGSGTYQVHISNS